MVWQQGYTYPDLVVAMSDLNRDGIVETLFCGETDQGTAKMVAAEPDGTPLWEHVFEGVGTDGLYSGLSRWFVGDFVGDDTKDVGVVRHRLRSANEMCVLDGRTGTLVWNATPFVPAGGSYSANVMCPPVSAIHDFNGDGKDDIAYMPVWYTLVLSGTDGSLLHGKSVTDIYGRTLNYPYLMVADCTSDGAMDIILHGPTMHTMAQTHDTMQKLWYREFEGNTANFFPPAVSDVDNDGAVELGMPGTDGVFRCLRASDGKVLWQENLNLAGYGNVGAADVDGDGTEDYFYFSTTGDLVAVRGTVDPGQSRLLWTLHLGTFTGGHQHPIFADVDGDGKGEFLVVSGDGRLRCIDQQ
jgi:outer membrane protein assembly factor BamB